MNTPFSKRHRIHEGIENILILCILVTIPFGTIHTLYRAKNTPPPSIASNAASIGAIEPADSPQDGAEKSKDSSHPAYPFYTNLSLPSFFHLSPYHIDIRLFDDTMPMPIISSNSIIQDRPNLFASLNGMTKRTIRYHLPQNRSRYWRLEYRYTPSNGAQDTVNITLRGTPYEIDARDGGSAQNGPNLDRHYILTLRKGTQHIYFYHDYTGIVPETLEIETPSNEFTILRITQGSIPPSPNPIPADIGTIFHHTPYKLWRHTEWELFQWNLDDGILILDSRTYHIQSQFFKRLAFFTEKKGFTGQLLTDTELIGRHGWNAHNYRPADLARFYTAARQQGIALNQYEHQLFQLLLHNGQLHETDDREILAGQGGIIGISQESPPLLRRLLLRHEILHGTYYAFPAYRDAVMNIWNSLSDDERHVWRLFLGSQTYNPDDEYLVVNEFQAYLLQQPLENSESYFQLMMRRLTARRPDVSSLVRQISQKYPQSFSRAAIRAHNALELAITTSNFFCVEPL